MVNNKEMEIKNKVVATRDEAGNKLSWGAVTAGVVTLVVIFIMLTLLSMSIGLGMVEPTLNNALEGVGTKIVILAISTIAISFMIAGFISGISASKFGFLHGFLTWSVGILMIIIIVSYTAVGALSAVGSMFGSITSSASGSASTLTSSFGNTISSGINNVSSSLSSINTENLEENTMKILKDTKVKELQPEYLKSELDNSISIITEAGKESLIHPENSEEIINEAVSSLKEISQKIDKSVNKEAIANAVAANTNFSEEEASKVTDNIYNQVQNTTQQVEKQIDAASKELKNVNTYLKDTIDEAKEISGKAAKATSKASLWLFIAMISSLFVTSIFGWLGASLSRNRKMTYL